ncbi:HNH endonuclease [Methanolobus sp. WCC5]|uniref:HNH endonuclease n=1 Tax=Methanolobus sp. WCC5 TaxID=3125785 RepID=UPI0032559151
MDKKTYRNSVKMQKLNGKATLRCIKCAEDDESVIEMHHVYGKSNSDETIPLCKNCHAKITKEQNKLPRNVRTGYASSDDRLKFILVSVGALLEGIGKELRLLGLEVTYNE